MYPFILLFKMPNNCRETIARRIHHLIPQTQLSIIAPVIREIRKDRQRRGANDEIGWCVYQGRHLKKRLIFFIH